MSTNESKNSPFLSLLFGLLLLIFSLFMVSVFSQTHDLSCSRLEPSLIRCTSQSKLFNLYELQQRTFENISQAILAESCDEDGCSCRVEMQTESGMTPLNIVYMGGIGGCDSQQKKANTINAFLADTTAVTMTINPTTSEHLMTFFPIIFVLSSVFIVINGLRRVKINFH